MRARRIRLRGGEPLPAASANDNAASWPPRLILQHVEVLRVRLSCRATSRGVTLSSRGAAKIFWNTCDVSDGSGNTSKPTAHGGFELRTIGNFPRCGPALAGPGSRAPQYSFVQMRSALPERASPYSASSDQRRDSWYSNRTAFAFSPFIGSAPMRPWKPT